MSNLETAPVEETCGASSESGIEVLHPRDVPLGGPRAIRVRRTLPQRQRSLVGAWCFADHYGPYDVRSSPGMVVPPHPHTGLQTVSWLFDGEIEHRDSGGVHAFVRPGELRHAEWTAMDLDGGEWRYTVTKTNTPHIVPLSSQAVATLRELKPLTGRGRYVFSSARSSQRPMSDNAILAAMRRMGIAKDEMSGHGFRAMARTILDEVLGFRPDFIEHQLAHAVRDPNGRAYNRTAHLVERRKMMQAWADYLDKLKNGADVIPILKAG